MLAQSLTNGARPPGHEEDTEPKVPPDIAAALQPFAPLPDEDMDREAAGLALRKLNRLVLSADLDPAPNASLYAREIGLDRIGGWGSVREALPRALERALDEACPKNLNGILKGQIRRGLASTLPRFLSLGHLDPPPLEVVVEILEDLEEYIAVLPAEVGQILRLTAEHRLRQRFGQATADDLLRKYVDPPPPGEPVYNDGGFLTERDFTTEPETDYLDDDGIIAVASTGLWYSPTGGGKTFTALALALGIAFGEDWLGTDLRTTGHVRYVAAEGSFLLERRIAAWLVSHGILPETFTRAELADVLDGRFSQGPTTLRLDDPKIEDALCRTMERDDTKLCALDTLGRLLGPSFSEDGNDTANAVVGMLNRVGARTGTTFILLHHPGWSAERSRGASAWPQAADWVFRAKGAIATGRPVRLINEKVRDGEIKPDRGYALRNVHMTCDGSRWDSAVAVSATLQDEESIPIPDQIRALLITSPGMTKTDVKDAITGRAAIVASEIQRLIKEGKIEDRGDGRGSVLHINEEAWPSPKIGDFDADMDLSDVTG